MDMTHLKGEPSRILHQCGKLVSAFLLCFTTRAKLIIKISLCLWLVTLTKRAKNSTGDLFFARAKWHVKLFFPSKNKALTKH